MEKRRILVLGGGITGLTAAYEMLALSRRRGLDLEVTVLEAALRPGGKVRTERRDGIACEAGPDSFVTNKPQALELVRELGLEGELLRTNPRDKTVGVLTRGRLRPLPEGMMLVLPTRLRPFVSSDLLSWRAKCRMALEPLVPAGSAGADESLGSFFRRRLGAEAVEKLVAPMLAGIYAADAEQLSLRSTFPQFLEMERRGGLLAGLWRRRRAAPPAGDVSLFMTLKGGLSRLTDALAARLPQGSLRCGQAVESLRRRGDLWEVEAGGAVFEAESVVSALPANVLAPLLSGADAELSSALAEIPFASTATVTLAYNSDAFPRGRAEGFGFLVPKGEGRITAATFVSSKFPGRVPPGTVLIRCFLGGAGREEQLAGDDDALAASAAAELGRVLGLGGVRPRWSLVARWPSANPQYVVGHEERLKNIASRLKRQPGLVLAGASYRGVGLPDCIRSGRQAAAEALEAAAPAAAGVC